MPAFLSREWQWLDADTVLAIHQRQLAEHGGLAGIRDAGLLASALARPQQLIAYAHPIPDIATLAASYAYGIVRNHPFLDGNKRTAFVVHRLFMRQHGEDIVADKIEAYCAFMNMVDGTLQEADFARWLRAHKVIKTTP
jgi:death-on-curing protein